MARERLRDATEAFELAERQEREIEAEYEAWKLLLDQMKEADAAQASNLGQALAPAIAGRFQELTQRRYETVQLTAQLGTEGVVVAGAVRSAAQIICRHPRAIVHTVPVVAGGIFADGDRPGRPARPERRQPDGLVSRVAYREGSQSSRSSSSRAGPATTLQRHRWCPKVRAFMQTRIMGSSERSILGGHWANNRQLIT